MDTHNTKTLAIRGVAFNWFGRVASILISFFLTPFLVLTLGDHRYGLWSLVMSLTDYYTLADMGLRGATTKYVAEYAAKNDREAINRVVVVSLVVYWCLSIVVLLVACGVAWCFPYFFKLGDVSPASMRIVVVLGGITVMFRLISQVFNATITAFQRHDISNIAAISSQLAQALCVVLALWLGTGLVGMAVATLLVVVIGQMIRTVVATRLLPDIKFSLRYFDRETLRKVFSFGSITVFTQVTEQIGTKAAPIAIGVLSGPAAVAWYSVADSLAHKGKTIGQTITSVIMPLASRLKAEGRQSTLQEVFLVASRVFLGLGLSLAAIFYFFGQSIFDLWIRRGFASQAFPILCVLTWAMVARTQSQPVRAMLRGTGRNRMLAKVAIINAIVTITVGPVLAYAYGPFGMALAVTLGCLITDGVLNPIIGCRETGCKYSHYMVNTWSRGLMAAAAPTIAAWTIMRFVPPTNLAWLVLEAGFVLALAALSIFVICLTPNRRDDVIKAFLSRRSRPQTRAAKQPKQPNQQPDPAACR